MQWTEQFVKKAIPEVEIASWVHTEIKDVSIDSRSCGPGDFFVALCGIVADGHDFIQDAIKNGAVGIMLEKSKQHCFKNMEEVKKKCTVLLVNDSHESLYALAGEWRNQFEYPVVGITGSIGKTTTKEMLCAILAEATIPFIGTPGNKNTLIGASLSLLQMRPEHKVAVLEMGISKRGEMKRLAQMVKPSLALITNIGHTHMEGLGSINDIAAEKRAIFSTFKESNIGIINGDQQLLANVSYPHPIVKFGLKTTNQIQARKVKVGQLETSFTLKLYKEKYTVSLPTIHSGAVFNTLGALTAAYLLNVPVPLILNAIKKSVIVPGRFEQRKLAHKSGIIINDCYNANPESMKAALLAFQKLETDAPKIAVLGDMLELGANSPFWHRQLGRFMRKIPSLNRVILVGSLVEWTKKTAPVTLPIEIVPTWQEARDLLERELKGDSCVLVKGSNGLGLSNIIDAMT